MAAKARRYQLISNALPVANFSGLVNGSSVMPAVGLQSGTVGSIRAFEAPAKPRNRGRIFAGECP
jgi:hypothetical protein